MTTDLHGIPVPNSEYRVESIDGETLLYHVGQTRTVYLNDTASLIWSLCDGERSIEDIVELLVANYPDAAATINQDVNDALNQFITNEALEMKDAPDPETRG